jgi:hypothetical protein
MDQAVTPQTRWNENGGQYQVDPQTAPLDAHLKNLLSDPSLFRVVLDQLISCAAIIVERADGVEIIRVSTPVNSQSQDSTYWMEQVLRFFCHVFPREPLDL